MFLIRHGQSTYNAAQSLLGRDPQIPDPPLTPLGQAQVARAAEKLAGMGIKTLRSSPYTRALQTAQIIAERLSLPIVLEPLAGERRLYSCDVGSPVSVLQTQFPEVDFSTMSSASHEWWKPFPESHERLMARISALETESYAWEDRDRALIVSHWFFINGATGADPDNAEIVRWD